MGQIVKLFIIKFLQTPVFLLAIPLPGGGDQGIDWWPINARYWIYTEPSGHSDVVIEDEVAWAEFDYYYNDCQIVLGKKKEFDNPTTLYHWKSGESPVLVDSNFTGYFKMPFGQVKLSDSGTYHWRIGEDGIIADFELKVQPRIFGDIRLSAWDTGGCLSEDNEFWQYSSIISWNYSKRGIWPWIYHYNIGWLYLYLGNDCLWFYKHDESRYYYVLKTYPLFGISLEGDFIRLD